MKTPAIVAAGFLVLALSSIALYAQQAQPMKTGIGRIAGRVVTSDTGSPLRGAHVQISGGDGVAKTHVTDHEGRYVFQDLPSGRYTIKAFKPGYTSAAYGQTKPFGQGTLIDLMELTPVDGADIRMRRRGAISGRLVDEFGDPMPDTVVHAIRSTWVNGKRQLRGAVRTTQTNDLGQYRLHDLNPGEYYVSATPRTGPQIMSIEMAVLGHFSSGAEHSGLEPRTGYATTYYPGTQDDATALRIALAPGEDRLNTDFKLLPVKLARVTGTVFGSTGRPLGGALVNPTRRNSSDMMDGVRTDTTGNFTLLSVPPGEYTLRARSGSMSVSSEGGDLTVSMRLRTPEASQAEFGSVPLIVSGEDIADVRIATSRGTTVAGRVRWEGRAKPGNAASLRVRAIPIEEDSTGADSATVSPTGTFNMKGIAGQRLFRPGGLPEGWVMKSITLNGRDITDTGMDVKPNIPVRGLEMVLTSRVTEVSGSVKAGSDQTADYTVVVFAEDAEKWTLPMTRYIATTRPKPDGRFQVRLPPGSYYAVALEYIPRNDWNDAAVLERLKAKATRFTLYEGKAETLELQLSGS